MANEVTNDSRRRFSALVVDNYGSTRSIHAAFLRRHGFETCEAENGKHAVDLIRSGREFDVIFMDIVMPIMNGVEATRELRAMGVKSMIVGIDCDPDYLDDDFFEAGMDRFYEKPMKNRIVISVRQALENRQNM